MQRTDAGDFDALLQQVFECYDRKPPSTAAATMWFDALKEFLYPDVRLTLLHWIKTKPKAPTIAEVVSQLRDRTSASLERSADADKARFRDVTWRGPTEVGRRVSEAVKELLGQSKTRDPKKWAKDILAAAAAQLPVTPVQFALATSALHTPIRERQPGEDDE